MQQHRQGSLRHLRLGQHAACLAQHVRRLLGDHPPRDVPLETTLHLLRRSPAYCSASGRLTSDVRETWDEDGVRFVVYGARDRSAVFAVPLSGDDPTAIRVALVDEAALAGPRPA